MIDRTYRCDRDGCDRHVQTDEPRRAGFLTVTGHGAARHYCGWECVMHAAAAVPRAELVEGDA